MEFFNNIKQEDLPKRQELKLKFFMRTANEGEFEPTTLNIITSGGQCHNVVQKQISAFFKGRLITAVNGARR